MVEEIIQKFTHMYIYEILHIKVTIFLNKYFILNSVSATKFILYKHIVLSVA